MLQYFLSGTVTFWGAVSILVGYAMLLFILLPVHEFAHAYTAHRLGDPTPKFYGRLTLNPLKHLDWFGAVMLVLCGIGYAKPVPVNPNYFRNPKRGMALTALAGPLSNLLMAAISLGVFRVVIQLTGGALYLQDGYVYYTSEWTYYAYLLLVQVFAGVNIGLAVFNLLPVPPLDGSRLLEPLLPSKWMFNLSRYQQYITLGVMVLLLTGALDVPLAFLRRVIGGLLCAVFGMPNLFG